MCAQQIKPNSEVSSKLESFSTLSSEREQMDLAYQTAKGDLIQHLHNQVMNPYVIEDLLEAFRNVCSGVIDLVDGISSKFDALDLPPDVREMLNSFDAAMCHYSDLDFSEIDTKIDEIKGELQRFCVETEEKNAFSKMLLWNELEIFYQIPEVKKLNADKLRTISKFTDERDKIGLSQYLKNDLADETTRSAIEAHLTQLDPDWDLYTFGGLLIERKPKGIVTCHRQPTTYFLHRTLILRDAEGKRHLEGKVLNCQREGEALIFELDNEHRIIVNRFSEVSIEKIDQERVWVSILFNNIASGQEAEIKSLDISLLKESGNYRVSNKYIENINQMEGVEKLVESEFKEGLHSCYRLTFTRGDEATQVLVVGEEGPAGFQRKRVFAFEEVLTGEESLQGLFDEDSGEEDSWEEKSLRELDGIIISKVSKTLTKITADSLESSVVFSEKAESQPFETVDIKQQQVTELRDQYLAFPENLREISARLFNNETQGIENLEIVRQAVLEAHYIRLMKDIAPDLDFPHVIRYLRNILTHLEVLEKKDASLILGDDEAVKYIVSGGTEKFERKEMIPQFPLYTTTSASLIAANSSLDVMTLDVSVEVLKAVKSVVIVMSATDFSGSGNPALALVENLRDKLPTLMTESGVNSRIYVLVNKIEHIEREILKDLQNGERFKKLREGCEDQRRKEIWSSFDVMRLNGHMDILDAQDKRLKAALLGKYLKDDGFLIPDAYSKATDRGRRSRNFDIFIARGIKAWGLLFRQLCEYHMKFAPIIEIGAELEKLKLAQKELAEIIKKFSNALELLRNAEDAENPAKEILSKSEALWWDVWGGDWGGMKYILTVLAEGVPLPGTPESYSYLEAKNQFNLDRDIKILGERIDREKHRSSAVELKISEKENSLHEKISSFEEVDLEKIRSLTYLFVQEGLDTMELLRIHAHRITEAQERYHPDLVKLCKPFCQMVESLSKRPGEKEKALTETKMLYKALL